MKEKEHAAEHTAVVKETLAVETGAVKVEKYAVMVNVVLQGHSAAMASAAPLAHRVVPTQKTRFFSLQHITNVVMVEVVVETNVVQILNNVFHTIIMTLNILVAMPM